MKNIFYVIIAAVAIPVVVGACAPKASRSSDGTRLKARFEQAGLCSNYTFTLVEGQLDTSLVEAAWTNPQTNKTYTNAFGVKNPCDLPPDLKEGDEFYFKIDEDRPNRCAVCMAYYPTPAKKLNIVPVP